MPLTNDAFIPRHDMVSYGYGIVFDDLYSYLQELKFVYDDDDVFDRVTYFAEDFDGDVVVDTPANRENTYIMVPATINIGQPQTTMSESAADNAITRIAQLILAPSDNDQFVLVMNSISRWVKENAGIIVDTDYS